MSHPIVHLELSASNRKEAAKFYSEVFGWQTEDMPGMDYTTFTAGEGSPRGGFTNVQADTPAGKTVVYIHTDDINASLAKVTAHGGKATSPAVDIPGVGTMLHFDDPTGNHMSLFKPAM